MSQIGWEGVQVPKASYFWSKKLSDISYQPKHATSYENALLFGTYLRGYEEVFHPKEVNL